MSKILITYGTRKGASAETARVIGEVLMDQFYCSVDIVDVKEIKPYLQKWREYDGVIIGSSITMGRWTAGARRFLRKRNFTGKKVAVYVSAGGLLHEANEKKTDKDAAVKEAVEKFLDKQLEGLTVKPVAKQAFGGWASFFGSKTINSWNKDDIMEWARLLGKIFS